MITENVREEFSKIRNYVEYGKKLKDNNVNVEIKSYKGLMHGF